MTEDRADYKNLDKMPPQSEDMEMSALGSFLLDPAIIKSSEHGLRPEHFYHSKHKIIFEAILALAARGDPVEIVSVSEELSKGKKLEAVGGSSYISNLLDSAVTTQHASYYAGKVREDATLRKVIEQATRTIRRAYAREDAHEVMSELASFATSPEHAPSRGEIDYFNLEKLLEEGKAYGHGGKDTGYPELNKIFRIMPQELTLITARIGQGKSSFAYNLLLNFLVKCPEEAFIFFNLDTSFPIAASRMATIKAARDYDVSYSYEEDVLPDYQRGTFKAEIAQAFEDFKAYGQEKRLVLANKPGYRVEQIIGYVEGVARERKLGAVFVDYMELIQASEKHDTEELRIAHITNALRIASERLSVPFIVLVQQSRDGETRERGGEVKQTPALSSLRYSGRQEAEAAKVLALVSDPKENKLTAITLKSRGGQSGKKIVFGFDMKSGAIITLDKKAFPRQG